ncbi:hypothetical protein DFH09DRAFT_1305931 [Mycena vulgaris]|nr:hypothetical protein DFH09DRAFT_1305931 [Mycena vulgaris]
MRWAFEAKSWAGKRVLLVHGTHGAVVPYGSSPILKSFLESVAADPNDEASSSSHVEVTQIPGAGHDLTYTHAEEVGRALLVCLGGSGA